jgi:hypothetical protein
LGSLALLTGLELVTFALGFTPVQDADRSLTIFRAFWRRFTGDASGASSDQMDVTFDRQTTMSRESCAIAVMFGLFVGLQICYLPNAAAAEEAEPPAIEPGMARVWFLRPTGAPYANVVAPSIFANGAALGDIPPNSDFYRDFPAGQYRFTV